MKSNTDILSVCHAGIPACIGSKDQARCPFDEQARSLCYAL